MSRTQLAEYIRVYLQGYDYRYIEGVQYKVIPSPPTIVEQMLGSYTQSNWFCVVVALSCLIVSFLVFHFNERSLNNKETTFYRFTSLLLFMLSVYLAIFGIKLGVSSGRDLYTIYTSPKDFVAANWEEYLDNLDIK